MFTEKKNTLLGVKMFFAEGAAATVSEQANEVDPASFLDASSDQQKQQLKDLSPDDAKKLSDKLAALSKAGKLTPTQVANYTNIGPEIAKKLAPPSATESVQKIVDTAAANPDAQETKIILEGVDGVKKETAQKTWETSVEVTGFKLEDFQNAFQGSQYFERYAGSSDKGRMKSLISALLNLVETGKNPEQLTKDDLKKAGYEKTGLGIYTSKAELQDFSKLYKIVQTTTSNGKDYLNMLATGSTESDSFKAFFNKVTAFDAKGADNVDLADKNMDSEMLYGSLDKINSSYSEKQLSDAMKLTGLDRKQIFENVTGEKLDGLSNSLAVTKFNQSLQSKINLLQWMVKSETKWERTMDAGLTKILQGDNALAQYVSDFLKNSDAGKIDFQTSDPRFMNSLSGAGSLLVSVWTDGIATIAYQQQNLDKEFAGNDTFANSIDEILGKKTGIKGMGQEILKFFGDIYTGEIGTLKFGNQDLKKNMLKDFEKNLGSYGDYLTNANALSLGIADGAKDLPKDIVFLQKMNPNASTVDIQNALIANALAKAVAWNEGKDWSFRIGPLFTGVNRQMVGQKFHEGGSEVSKNIEAKNNKIGNLTDAENASVMKAVTETVVDGKYVYAFPENFTLRNVSMKVIKPENTTFEKPQAFTFQAESHFDQSVLKIVPRDKTDAEQTSQVDHLRNQDISDKIQGLISNKLISKGSVEIREKYSGLQKDILAAVNGWDIGKIDKVLARANKEFNLSLKLDGITDKDTKVSILTALLGELAGDGRLRAVRYALLNDWKASVDLKRALLSIPRNWRLMSSTQADTLMNDKAALNTFLDGLTMKDMYAMLEVFKTWEWEGSNAAFTKQELGKIGITGIDGIQKTYRTNQNSEKIVGEGRSKPADAIGFMVNHQVNGGKVTFSGLSALMPEDQVLWGEKQKIEWVESAKFIDQLTSAQLDRIAPAMKQILGSDLTNDQIKQVLKDGKMGNVTVTPEFSYAEYPNCTNACVFMKIQLKNPSGVIIDVTQSGSLNIPENQASNFVAGINGVAAFNKFNKSSKTGDNPENPNPTKTLKPDGITSTSDATHGASNVVNNGTNAVSQTHEAANIGSTLVSDAAQSAEDFVKAATSFTRH